MPKVNGCQRDDERPETAVDALPKYRRGGSAQEIGGQFQPYPVAMALRRHSAEGSAQRSSRLSSATPGVPDEVVRVLSVLPSASLVVSPDGTVLRASTRAMALGLVNRSSVAVPEIAELVREQLLAVMHDELPYSIATRVTEFDGRRVRCEIVVERESQKGMVIGKGGAVLSAVRSRVKKSLPKGLALELIVVVDRNWQHRRDRVERMGY